MIGVGRMVSLEWAARREREAERASQKEKRRDEKRREEEREKKKEKKKKQNSRGEVSEKARPSKSDGSAESLTVSSDQAVKRALGSLKRHV